MGKQAGVGAGNKLVERERSEYFAPIRIENEANRKYGIKYRCSNFKNGRRNFAGKMKEQKTKQRDSGS